MDEKKKPVAAADQDPDAIKEDSITMDDGLTEYEEPGEDDEEDEEEDDDDDDGA
jgi:hypothetical protein